MSSKAILYKGEVYRSGYSGGGSAKLQNVTKTWAEYQALTPSQKLDPTIQYIVTDIPESESLPLAVSNGKLCVVWQREVT